VDTDVVRFALWELTSSAGSLNNRCLLGGRRSTPPGEIRRTSRVANIKSQAKRNRTNERRRLHNKSVKSSLHTATRAFREAAEAGDKDKAAELAKSASRKLDKAASKGVIHKSQAANRKSALALALNKL
jgi:small subunit ribosomal protein S20